jgi:chorismate mutase/prephenate dehydratase
MDQPQPGPGAQPPAADLAALRARVDEIDRRLVDLLSSRAAIVVEIGRAKRGSGTPIYAPHREREVIAGALARNPGPLPDRTLEAIFRELMSGSFALELPLRVGYLGPGGSFSHLAAVRHFGSSVECTALETIDDVFEDVAAGDCHYGLVPYENSIGGSVSDTLDALHKHNVVAYAETLLEVRQALLANCEPGAITRIHSKPEAFLQCRQWLARQFPGVELVPTASSAAAVRHAAGTPGAAAIGSELAGRIYGVNLLFSAIQDKPDNITRFLVIGREHAEPTGKDRTTIVFVTSHRPGALVDVLNVFRDAQVNLSHIDKRPSGRQNWEYTFFIDCEGHQRDAAVAGAIEEARAHCLSLKVVGSYPRAERIV